jgi:ABC-type glycerol-3-phosphate transport system substrate-binding protein
MTMSTKASLALAALIVLSACGGGGRDGGPAAVETLPDSAVASPESFSRWVGMREASETRDPLAIDAAVPPTSETAEPIEPD